MRALWHYPIPIHWGAGAKDTLGKLLSATHERVFLLAGKQALEAGHVRRIQQILRDYSQESVLCVLEVAGNLHQQHLDHALSLYREEGGVLPLVALGGGSVLDAAKLIRAVGHHKIALEAVNELPESAEQPLLVAIPTTAGTGSEVTGRAAYVGGEKSSKQSLISPALRPSAAVVDVELSQSLPAHIIASTGFIALTQCIEAYCGVAEDPFADAIALGAIELIAAFFHKAVNEPDNLDAREAMLKAACMSGVASHKSRGVCTALAHALASVNDMHHGLACAMCLPAVLDFNRSAVAPRLARIARLLGVRGGGDDVQTLAFECASALRALRAQVGLASGLSEAGVDESLLPKLASYAFDDSAHEDNPRSCRKEDILSLLQSSMA